MQQIRINGKTLEAYTVCGKVASASKHLETQVHGGGGGGQSFGGSGYSAPVHISSTTTTHDQIFLVDPSGSEHVLKLKNWDIACRESNEMMATWMTKKGGQKGPWVAIRNVSTGSTDYNDGELGSLARPKLLLLVLLLPFVTGFSGLSILLSVMALIAYGLLGVMGRRTIKQSGVLFEQVSR